MLKVHLSVGLLTCVSILHFLLSTNANAQKNVFVPGIEFSAGGGVVIYQSAFATADIFGMEVVARGGLNHAVQWQAGTRLWIDPISPELFGRIVLTQQKGAWLPFAGLELGATGKSKFSEGSQLLRETRNAMLKEAGLFYISSHIAPLSFTSRNNWRVSVAEINIGTHFKNMGRTLRLYVNIFSLSKSF